MKSGKVRGLTEIIKELAETSSVHGIPKIASSRQLTVKVLWCILFLTAVGVVTYNLVELFKTFYSNPIQTTVSLDFSTLQFPAISICNMNPVRKSKLTHSPDLMNQLFPKSRRSASFSNILKRRKRNVPKFVKSEFPTDSVPIYEVREIQENDGMFHDDDMKTILGLYNASTIEELMKTFGVDTSMSNGFFTVTQMANGSLAVTFNFTQPFVSDNIPTEKTSERVTFSLTVGNEGTTTPMSDNISVTSQQDNGTVFGLNHDDISETYTTEMPNLLDNLYDEFDWDIFESVETSISVNYTKSGQVVSEELAKLFHDPKDKWDAVKTEFKTTFRRIDKQTRKKMGHQLGEFVQYASFAKRQQKTSKYFKQFTTSDFGNCYTIDNSRFKSWRSGPETGIKLTLYLEVDEYVESFSSGYGVRIVFHEPGTFPMPTEEGLTLSPGYETSIGLRAINVTRLGEPYGECTVSGSERFRNKYNMTYSKTACLEFCRIENVISRCSCIPIDAPDIDFGANASVCQSKEELCVFEVEMMFEDGSLTCDCINPCSEFVYAKTISGRVWPHRDYLEKVLMKDMCKKNLTSLEKACRQVRSDTEEFDFERYRNNFVRLIIYFEDLNYQKITEEPFYSTVRFICDIGGAMGLFIGVSLLSLFEVLQLILEIVLYLVQRKKENPSVSDLQSKHNGEP